MKKIILILPFLALFACRDHKSPTVDEKQNILDSVRSANYANEIRQKIIDSMNTIMTGTPTPINDNADNNVAVHHNKHTGKTEHHTTKDQQANNNTPGAVNENTTNATNTGTNSTASTDKKKKMSNKTKGAIIGAGVGVVTGAVTGAATSKNKGKGAVVGGIIGGAVGSGIGYGIGDKKDKKEKKDTIK